MPTEKQLANLIPFSKRTKEEARASGIAGGKASGITRRRKKNMAELAKIINNMPLSKANKATFLAQGFDEEDATNQMAFMFSVFSNAVGNKNKEANVGAMKLWIDITINAEKRELENKKLKEEIKILKAQQQQMSDSATTDVEDLTPLAELLKGGNDDV